MHVTPWRWDPTWAKKTGKEHVPWLWKSHLSSAQGSDLWHWLVVRRQVFQEKKKTSIYEVGRVCLDILKLFFWEVFQKTFADDVTWLFLVPPPPKKGGKSVLFLPNSL